MPCQIISLHSSKAQYDLEGPEFASLCRSTLVLEMLIQPYEMVVQTDHPTPADDGDWEDL